MYRNDADELAAELTNAAELCSSPSVSDVGCCQGGGAVAGSMWRGSFSRTALIVEPPVPGLFPLALTRQGSSCRVLSCKGFLAMLGGIPEISSGNIGGCKE